MTEQTPGGGKKKFSIARLFQSNRFVLIFSLFAAIVLWFIMAFNNTENIARVIDNVPIQIALTEEAQAKGYAIFSVSDSVGQVSVTGSSLTVNQLSGQDMILTTQQAASITRTGTYTLNLTASQNSDLQDYSFDSVSPGSVIVFVDKKVEKEFTVQPEIQYTVADGYYAATPTLSDARITVSGPETEVSQIDHISVQYTVDGTLQDSVDFTAPYVYCDADGNVLTDLKYLTASSQSESVKIDVLKMEELPVKVNFQNLSDGMSLSSYFTVTPSTLKIGYSEGERGTSSLQEVPLKAIDLSTIGLTTGTVKTTFELPRGWTNISGVKEASVLFDLSSFGARAMTVDQFVLQNVPNGISAELQTKELDVTILAPEDQLEAMQNSQLTGVVDLNGMDQESGNLAVPVTIQINGTPIAWAYGSYTVTVKLVH